jgi:glycerol uptake facilitator-like aquaporin
MISKYKPAIYFGIFCAILNPAITLWLMSALLTGKNLTKLIVSALIGALVGGALFQLMCNRWLKYKTAKS